MAVHSWVIRTISLESQTISVCLHSTGLWTGEMLRMTAPPGYSESMNKKMYPDPQSSGLCSAGPGRSNQTCTSRPGTGSLSHSSSTPISIKQKAAAACSKPALHCTDHCFVALLEMQVASCSKGSQSFLSRAVFLLGLLIPRDHCKPSASARRS